MARIERKWQILFLISVGSFMAFLDAPVLSVAFPSLQRSFSSTHPTTLAWTLDAYFIGFAAFLVVAGKAADRYGRRRLFTGGLLAFTLASIVCAIAPSIGILIAARAGQAIAAACVVPAGQGLLLVAFPPEERKAAIGALAALVALATALAPAIGGGVIQVASWRWIFWLSAAGVLGALAWAIRLLDDDSPKSQPAPTPDLLGACIQALSLGLLVLAILESSRWGLLDSRTAALLAGAVVLACVFLWRCTHHAAPLIDLALFRNRTFTLANIGSLLLGVGLYAMAINSVLYFTGVWGWTSLAAGVSFIPGSLASAVMGKPAGQLAQRFGPRIVAACGAGAAGAGILLIALSTSQSANYAGAFLPGQLVYGFGVVAAMSALIGAALTSAPPPQFALASGINNAVRQVGGAIGVAVTVAIVGNAVGHEAVHRGHIGWVVAGACLLAAATISLLIRSPRPEVAPSEETRTAHEPLRTEAKLT